MPAAAGFHAIERHERAVARRGQSAATDDFAPWPLCLWLQILLLAVWVAVVIALIPLSDTFYGHRAGGKVDPWESTIFVGFGSFRDVNCQVGRLATAPLSVSHLMPT
jgi:hypothetical protein